MVKIKKNSIRFIFDKYNTGNQLSLMLDNLKGELDWRGVVKKIKGEFGVFIIKKKIKGKWGELYAPLQEEDVTLSDFGDKIQETLISEEIVEDDLINNSPLDQQMSKNGKQTDEYGELTNELVEAMYENKKNIQKMTRRKSRAKSLVKNFKNIMNKYGNQSRKHLGKKSNNASNRRIGEKTSSDMESFLQNENQVSSKNDIYNGTVPKVRSKFGCKSSDQLENVPHSRSLSKSKTGKVRLSHLMNPNSSGKNFIGRDKSKEEAKTGLISEKKDTEKKMNGNENGKGKGGDFKVLTMDELMQREHPSSTNRNHLKKRRKSNLKLISEISSEPYLLRKKNPFKKSQHMNSANLLPEIGDEQMQRLEDDLQRHKDKFLSNNIQNRQSIYHQQMSKNYLENLQKSRKSIRGIDMLTNAYRRITKKQIQKQKERKLENSPSILEELKIEISNDFPIIQNSSVDISSKNVNLPVKSQVSSKSHRVLRNQVRRKMNKSNPRSRNNFNKRLRNIEKSFKPKSVPKQSGIRSLSRAYANKNKSKKNKSIVFTKPKNNKRKVKPKGASKSAVHHRSRSNLKRSKIETSKMRNDQLQKIYQQVSGKKQEILDTFAGLSLDMGWIHKQCRHMNLSSSEGVVKFLEVQNRLIVKLATKLRKEKNSRYRVEQQCQKMMEKFSKKLD
jgi:hypothetical protein